MKHLSILSVCAILLVGAGCSSAPASAPTATPTPVTTVPTETKPSICANVTASHIPVGDVLSLAKQNRASSFDVIASAGASVVSLDGGKTYGVWWAPEGFDPATGTVLVSLHGHGEYAAKDFDVWYPIIKDKDIAIFAPQWWFGRSLEDNGYYGIDRINAIVEEGLKAESITSPNVILLGYSMGSARSYGVTMWNHLCGSSQIGVTISASGEWEDTYQMYADMLAGKYGEKPLDGDEFILFCGEKDTERVGECDRQKITQTKIESLGAVVTDFLTDPNGGHGSLNQNPANADAALAAAEEDLK